MKIIATGPITSSQIEGEKVGTVADFIVLGSKLIVDSDCSHEIKRRLLLGRRAMPNLENILHHLAEKVLYSQSYCFSSSDEQI